MLWVCLFAIPHALVLVQLVVHGATSWWSRSYSSMVHGVFALLSSLVVLGAAVAWPLWVVPAFARSDAPDLVWIPAILVTLLSPLLVMLSLVPGRLTIDGHTGLIRYGHVMQLWPRPVIGHVDRAHPLGKDGRGHVDLWGYTKLLEKSLNSYNGNVSTSGEFSEAFLSRLVEDVNGYLAAFRGHDTEERRALRRPFLERATAILDARRQKRQRRKDREERKSQAALDAEANKARRKAERQRARQERKFR